ncbi:beta-glucosidase [Chaetoceros tenuissimus]|uniref:Beta-glucosidase n=1 Tax=Chaetoceros tenuissimus TaxID=426638 RepID=A0AAD3CUL6_9STRA|nr:beta-glucosidase [Chaetoceros tenuissimus]
MGTLIASSSISVYQNNITPDKTKAWLRKSLPERILVGYTTNKCEDLNDMGKVTTAVKDGVNVLIWCFLAFDNKPSSSNGHEAISKIKSGLNVDNFIKYKKQLIDLGYNDVVHLTAFGGWNGFHLPSGYSAEQLFHEFQSFNSQQDHLEDPLFDGIDWDLEGHDNVQSPNNEFTKECLDQMGEFSKLAKVNGLIVSLAPPESYLDITSRKFSRFVNLTYPEPWHQDFEYHGANVYSYILAKWNDYIDFVFLQFYESYSHAAYQISALGISPSKFLVSYMEQLYLQNEGLVVHFQEDPSMDLENQFVSLKLEKLVLGFANGWALNDDIHKDKVIFFKKKDLEEANNDLTRKKIEPRGFGFWVIEEEGKHDVNYAKSLADILFKKHEVKECDDEPTFASE